MEVACWEEADVACGQAVAWGEDVACGQAACEQAACEQAACGQGVAYHQVVGDGQAAAYTLVCHAKQGNHAFPH